MKKIKYIICLVLSALFALSAIGCGSASTGTNSDDVGTPPDYSTAEYEPFEYYAYHSLQGSRYQKDGGWVDAEKSFMEDPEYMKHYLDTGMKTMFFQAIQYQQDYIENGKKEDFETSDLKKYMDMAYEAGMEKSLISDWRFYILSCMDVDHLYKVDDLTDSEWEYEPIELSREKEIIAGLQTEPNTINLVNGDFRFETKSELVNFLAGCIKEYENHPLFSAILLKDEPTWNYVNAAADIFEAVRIYNPEIRIQQNLLPMYGDGNMFFDVSKEDENLTKEEQYTKYLNDWLSKTKAGYIMFDSYPIRGNGIETYHLKGLKIAADICKENNAEFYLVMQTTSFNINGNLSCRKCEKSDLYWQINMALGYGAAKIMCYTYFTKAGGSLTTGEYSFDGGAFMTHKGEKTEIYYYMQDIIGELDWFAPVIKNFRYNASATVKTLPLDNPVAYDYDKNDEFEKLKSVTVDAGDIALISELKDSARGNYLYMVQNVVDPDGGKTYDTTIKADIEFDSQYEYVAIYYKGTVRYQKLVDHKYSTILSAGYAEFLMPY